MELTEARRVILAHESEAEFQATVFELVELVGGRVYHHFDSRKQNADGKGFPDLVIASAPHPAHGRRTLILAELKDMDGKTSRYQDEWLRVLGECHRLESGVYRPDRWEELAALIRNGR